MSRALMQQPIHFSPRAAYSALIVFAGLTACGILAAFVMAWTLGAPIAVRPPPAPPALEIQTINQTLIGKSAEGLEARAAAQRRLDSYGWVDRQRGVARIPIRRAMQLVAGGAQ